MKIKVLMPFLAVLLMGSFQLNAEEIVQYTVTNNFGAQVRVGTCQSIGGTTTCQNFDLLPGLYTKFTHPKNTLTTIYFWNPKSNREEILDVTDPNWRTFTISPEGRITGQ